MIAWHPWFRYVGGALAAAAVVAAVFGYGYLKGSHSKEIEIRDEMNAALTKQREVIEAMHARQITAITNKHRGESEARRIKTIARPSRTLCDAGDDWLHAIQNSVRAANYTTGAAGAAAPAD